MKIALRIFLLVLLVAVVLLPRIVPVPPMAGKIVSISEPIPEPLPHREIQVSRNSGMSQAMSYETNKPYRIGDMVLLQQDEQNPELLIVSERLRTTALLQLFLVFIIVVVAVSGWHGIRSLLGLMFSMGVIFKFVLPQIIAGANPLVVALMASLIILLVSYFITHGINTKAVIAVAGTFGALIVTGLLANLFGQMAGLTGFGAEETGFLLDKLPLEGFYNLLLAGIIIGSLGVLDDITISQAAIVEELKMANHRLGIAELFARAMRIGHDHIASLVNTLILVYAGSTLPLLVLFVVSQTSVVALFNYEAVAEEIVRTLVGSIGLVTAVPLTTIVAAYWYSQKK